MAVILRPYQATALEAVRQAYREHCRAPLLVMPTGAGKTLCFSRITHGAAQRGKRVMILAHRIELIDQISDALKLSDTKHCIVAGGYPRHGYASVIVASVQTLVRRLADVPAPDLIICDEAHHVANGNTWSAIFKQWPNAHRLGVTATPVRLDGRGLGEHFDRMIMGPTVAELTGEYLSAARIFAPPGIETADLHIRAGEYVHAEVEAAADRPSITGDALAHYRKYADGKPAIVFCTSVKHAEHVAEQFRAGGYQAVSLNGGTAREIRKMAVDDFKRGALQVMASCDLFSEGFDVPGIHVGILLRPTASLGLYLQQVGRCLRVAQGKTEAILLDHASNVRRFGLPTDSREWALTYDETKRKAKPALSIRVCPKCWAASSSRSRVCTNCGHEYPVEPRQVDEREGELQEITPEMLAKRRERQAQGRARTLEELRAFAKMKGYAPGWAERIWRARQQKAVSRFTQSLSALQVAAVRQYRQSHYSIRRRRA